ncbi:MAG: urate hydroxylase PuuD [Pyrinomonadaceae bacterium]
MLFESTVYLPVGLGMFQEIFHAPDAAALVRTLLRWSHFVAGIAWIGLLYFFNLVNVPLQKEIDADTKKKVNPGLLTRALWYFRWGAVVTVLVGLMYFAMYILSPDAKNARAFGGTTNTWLVLLVWLLFPLVIFFIEFFLIQRGLIKDGRVLAVIMAVLVILMSVGIVYWLNGQLTTPSGESYASNKTHSIGIGGAMGVIMMLNVWGIIWPSQKRIIAATTGKGPAAPPELARRAFLASRTNAWLSLPMLFFMATSHGDWIILGK